MKKIVHYTGEPTAIEIGHGALVFTVDHPHCSNKNLVQTSKVLSWTPGEGFETENTIYRQMDPHRV